MDSSSHAQKVKQFLHYVTAHMDQGKPMCWRAWLRATAAMPVAVGVSMSMVGCGGSTDSGEDANGGYSGVNASSGAGSYQGGTAGNAGGGGVSGDISFNFGGQTVYGIGGQVPLQGGEAGQTDGGSAGEGGESGGYGGGGQTLYGIWGGSTSEGE